MQIIRIDLPAMNNLKIAQLLNFIYSNKERFVAKCQNRNHQVRVKIAVEVNGGHIHLNINIIITSKAAVTHNHIEIVNLLLDRAAVIDFNEVSTAFHSQLPLTLVLLR